MTTSNSDIRASLSGLPWSPRPSTRLVQLTVTVKCAVESLRMVRAASRATSETTSRRERRVREVHDRIVGAARERFAAHGVEIVKVDEICEAADIAQKTFFNHFPTK